jgi:hypothetical protein
MRHFFFVPLLVCLIYAACKPLDKRISGVYKNSKGDTIRLMDNHNFRVELVEPDTVESQQFKFTTGRWNRIKKKVYFNEDSRSMGHYWECVPLHLGWKSLSRPEKCDKEDATVVYHKVHVKAPKKSKLTEEEQYEKDKKKKEKEAAKKAKKEEEE